MSRKALWVVGGVVLLVLVAIAGYAASMRDTAVSVIIVGVIILVAIALSVVVSRREE